MAAHDAQPDAEMESAIERARSIARSFINRQVGTRMIQASQRVAGFSQQVREIGSDAQTRHPNETIDTVTQRVTASADRLARYLAATDPERAFSDLRRLGREKPALAAGVTFLLGFGVARLIKASPSSR